MSDRQTEDVLDQRQPFADPPTLSQAELQLEGEHGAPFGAQPFIPRLLFLTTLISHFLTSHLLKLTLLLAKSLEPLKECNELT